jgi:hypothetical protein
VKQQAAEIAALQEKLQKQTAQASTLQEGAEKPAEATGGPAGASSASETASLREKSATPSSEPPESPELAIGGMRISGDSRIGCTNREDYERLVGYVAQEDEQAFKQAVGVGIVCGTTTIFQAGEVVYITDTAVFSGLVKVRRKGETLEYWTNVEAVK